MAVALVIQTIGERAYTLGRKVVLAGVIALVAVGLWQMAPAIGGLGWRELIAEFRATTAGQIIVAPFEVFGQTIAAETLIPEFMLWAGAALAVNAALAAIVLWLDANYLEAAAAVSEKRYELISRAERPNDRTRIATYGALAPAVVSLARRRRSARLEAVRATHARLAAPAANNLLRGD